MVGSALARSRGELGMLRLRRFCATCTLVLACLFALAALQSGAAQAQDKKPETQSAKKKTPRLTVTISPTWIFSTSGDVDSPPAPGWKGIGYTNDNPIVDTARVDWAVDYLFAPKWHVYANENYYAYQLSRITTLAPKTAFVSGSILDTWQNFGVSTAPFTGLKRPSKLLQSPAQRCHRALSEPNGVPRKRRTTGESPFDQLARLRVRSQLRLWPEVSVR